MRIDRRIRLMMTTDAVGGVWTFATTLARALVDRGYEILLVTQGPRPSAEQIAMLSGVPGIELLQTDLMLEWQDPAGVDKPRAAAVLSDIAGEYDPDIVHLNGYRDAAHDWAVPTVVVAHSCVTTWAGACDARADFRAPEWTTYRRAVRRGLGCADAWVAPTRVFRDEIAACYAPIPAGRMIHNGIDGLSERHTDKQRIVLGVGRLGDKAKQLDALTELAQSLNWPVRIAGSRLSEKTKPTENGNCRLLGGISHAAVRDEMQRAAIFVSPALYEPFGLSVLEAAQAGCALVLSDLPTFRELWSGAAAFVDRRDRGALRDTVRSLCTDGPRRAALQQAARDRAARYRITTTAQRYDALYRSQLAASTFDPAVAEEITA